MEYVQLQAGDGLAYGQVVGRGRLYSQVVRETGVEGRSSSRQMAGEGIFEARSSSSQVIRDVKVSGGSSSG